MTQGKLKWVDGKDGFGRDTLAAQSDAGHWYTLQEVEGDGFHVSRNGVELGIARNITESKELADSDNGYLPEPAPKKSEDSPGTKDSPATPRAKSPSSK